MENQKVKAKETEKQEFEKYFKVLFSEKTSTNDTDDVELSVNGETLVIQRGIDVIIPGRFKICADNATYQQFTQVPGKPRKLCGTIKRYPYQLLGEASKKDFLDMKQTGDQQTKAHIAKFGFDGVPEGS